MIPLRLVYRGEKRRLNAPPALGLPESAPAQRMPLPAHDPG